MTTPMQLKCETSATCGDNSLKLKNRFTSLKAAMQTILDRYPNNSDMSLTDSREFDAIMQETKRIGNLPDNKYNFQKTNPNESDFTQQSTPTFLDTKTGRPVHVLQPYQRVADLPSERGESRPKLSIGKLIRGMACGIWKDAAAEKLAMSEGQNSGGGYLFGDQFSSIVIDYARNRAACIQAGAITIPWSNSDALNLARIVADPVFATIAENTEILEQSLTFDMVSLNAQKICALISASRELMEDASNCAQIIEQTLSRSLAVALDKIALTGSGSQEPVGLKNYKDVTVGANTGPITWEAVHGAAVGVKNGNFIPSGYICSPTVGGDLDIITSGDGETLAKTWLGPPPSLRDVPRYESKNAADNLFIGDFSQLVLGIRSEGSIEMSNQAGTSFAKHQTFIKCVFRGDFAVLNSAAFQVLAGITSGD